MTKAYDGDDSEDEELEDERMELNLEETDPAVGSARDPSEETDSEEDEDDLGCSLNKMSITPKDTLLGRGFPGNLGHLARMPAKIRPSTSPV